MKRLAFVFAVSISVFVNGQSSTINSIITEYEMIQERANYVEDPNFKKITYGNFLISGIISLNELYNNQPQLDIVPVIIHSGNGFRDENFISYFSKFNIEKYLDTTKYEISLEIVDVIKCSSQNPDDPNLVVTNIGYQESILIKNISSKKAVLLIDIFYLNQSSKIRAVNVFNEDRLVAF